jgi:hypothetical protein
MCVLRLGVLLNAASPIGESGGELTRNFCLNRQGAATVRLASDDTAQRCWWTGSGKGCSITVAAPLCRPDIIRRGASGEVS